MNRVKTSAIPCGPCEIVDFDEALLDACPAGDRSNLLVEARLLAQAFAADGGVEELEAIASSLSAGEHDAEITRSHARKLAAALRRLARAPWD